MKKIEVDVERSLGYQANGRVEENKYEKAGMSIKKFICPDCHAEEVAEKKTFGEVRKCKYCKTTMLNQY